MELWHKKWERYTVHPNLRTDYFHTIDTKEKAYWLGFLYADGFVATDNMRIGIKLNRNDEDTIDRFCECLGLEKSRKNYLVEETGNDCAGIRFACKEMSNDLIKNGMRFRKSKIIEYPKLYARNLQLAFLLGYYDGDGQQNTTIITSGSIRFLRQVKNRFNLPYRIQVTRRESEINGRRVRGTKYYLCLGAKLFNKMMENYRDSMHRKRWFPCDPKEKARRAAESSTSEMKRMGKEWHSNWRAVTKDNLEKMIWQMPSERIASMYGVTGKTVEKRCKKFGISKPGRSYWQKQRSSERDT